MTIVLNTGIRPPKEVLSIKKEHVNLSDEARYCKVEKTDVLIPPQAVLVAKGKDGRPRVLPLNSVTQRVFKILVADCVTGDWLFTNREGEQMQAIKKGFTAACRRAGIADLRPYDLRHTFATRLLERGVHPFVISALLGHSTPVVGCGFNLRKLTRVFFWLILLAARSWIGRWERLGWRNPKIGWLDLEMDIAPPSPALA